MEKDHDSLQLQFLVQLRTAIEALNFVIHSRNVHSRTAAEASIIPVTSNERNIRLALLQPCTGVFEQRR